MNTPRIPRVPEYRRAARFGTDPDSRPPMRPRDAYLAILAVVVSVLGVIALVSGSVVMVGELVTETRAQVRAGLERMPK